jgi:hypothetical protein
VVCGWAFLAEKVSGILTNFGVRRFCADFFLISLKMKLKNILFAID